MKKPITSRPLDLVYLIFFSTHIPIMFLIDLYPLYPPQIPQTLPFLTTLRTYYKTTYRDRFFTGPAPAWFTIYIWMELLLHVPVSLFAVQGLLVGGGDDPTLPLPLLVLSVQIAVTTATCVAEALSWDGFTASETAGLMGLYVPYLVFALFMGADMYSRLHASLSRNGPAVATRREIGGGRKKEL